MAVETKTSRGFTGWHMLGTMIAFFGTIIIANFTMAYFAAHSWSGLVVENSYVASQEFNEKAEAGKQQAALGWQVNAALDNGDFVYTITDKMGAPVRVNGGTVEFKHPVGDVHDTRAVLEVRGEGILGTSIDLADGSWIMEINADAGLNEPYRRISRVLVRNGKIH
ncbi:FixH family protein [Daeguia caeni]|uniref:FixH family protein n=1 Tax=Daeguia caeni TaxID=439612 RepID=A0ABV9H6N8_9HYPH